MAHVFSAGVIRKNLRFSTGWSQDLREKQVDDFMRTQLKKGTGLGSPSSIRIACTNPSPNASFAFSYALPTHDASQRWQAAACCAENLQPKQAVRHVGDMKWQLMTGNLKSTRNSAATQSQPQVSSCLL